MSVDSWILDLLPVENSYCFCSHDMLFTSGTCGRVLAHCHILEDDGSKHWKNNNDWTWRAVCLHLKPISLLLVIVDCQTREGVTLLCHKFNNGGLEFGPIVIPSKTCMHWCSASSCPTRQQDSWWKRWDHALDSFMSSQVKNWRLVLAGTMKQSGGKGWHRIRVRGQGKGKCGAGQLLLTVETKTGEIYRGTGDTCFLWCFSKYHSQSYRRI